jgi:hypothetical protein
MSRAKLTTVKKANFMTSDLNKKLLKCPFLGMTLAGTLKTQRKWANISLYKSGTPMFE